MGRDGGNERIARVGGGGGVVNERILGVGREGGNERIVRVGRGGWGGEMRK